MTGWHVQFGYLVTIQPVGTDEARAEALARWQSLPAYIDTEIANLREGLKLGYSAPKGISGIVIEQVNTLISGPAADSPFMSPAQRDKTPDFRKAWGALVKDQLTPAFIRYRDFLSKEYLPAARTEIAVAALPMGGDCYRASVRVYSTLTVPAREIHELGLQRMDGLMAEMKTIAERSFGTSDVQGVLKTLRTDRRYMFTNREELIQRSTAALARAKAAAPRQLRASAEIRRDHSAVSEVPREERTQRIQPAGGRRQPAGHRSSSAHIRPRRRARQARNRPRSTRRSRAITFRSPSRSSGRRSIPSAAICSTAATSRDGRCTPNVWPTR